MGAEHNIPSLENVVMDSPDVKNMMEEGEKGSRSGLERGCDVSGISYVMFRWLNPINIPNFHHFEDILDHSGQHDGKHDA